MSVPHFGSQTGREGAALTQCGRVDKRENIERNETETRLLSEAY